MSIHWSGGGGCGCCDGALSQVGLVQNGGELMGPVTLCAALLKDAGAAAAAVDWGADRREGERFPRRGCLTQGQRQTTRSGLLLFAAQCPERAEDRKTVFITRIQNHNSILRLLKACGFFFSTFGHVQYIRRTSSTSTNRQILQRSELCMSYRGVLSFISNGSIKRIRKVTLKWMNVFM